MSGQLINPSDPRQDIHELFHHLWSRDAGLPGYDKAKWKKLEDVLFVSTPVPLQEARALIYGAILREREYQEKKRGPNHRLDVGAWLVVLKCELQEAEQEWVKKHPDDSAALCEILQVCAVCVACLEQHGISERK
jgi:hypothetical protein